MDKPPAPLPGVAAGGPREEVRGMDIKATPEEIAALVVAIQERRKPEITSPLDYIAEAVQTAIGDIAEVEQVTLS